MQIVFILLFLLSLSEEALSAEGPFYALRQRSNQLYKTSQEMVEHGMEGHLHEMISYGNNLLRQGKDTLKEINLAKIPPTQRDELTKMLIRLQKKTQDAIAFSKQNQDRQAVQAARTASFIAKHIRQKIDGLR